MNCHTQHNEGGFVLVTAMVMLLVLTMIGFLANKNTTTELMISGNDRVHKQTFYQADGGTELMQRMLFENAVCTATDSGFTGNYNENNETLISGSVLIKDLSFADKNDKTPSDVSDTDRYMVYYPTLNLNDSAPHTNFLTTSQTSVNVGSGLQMVSGYEGLGVGAAGGGSNRTYTIASQHHGLSKSQSLIQVKWRLDNFIIASASQFDCNY